MVPRAISTILRAIALGMPPLLTNAWSVKCANVFCFVFGCCVGFQTTEETLETLQIQEGSEILIEFAQAEDTWVLGGYDKAQEASMSPSSAAAGKSVRPGLTGLVNLGNTCYMNSALQCLSNTRLLRDYFLKEEFLYDINPKAPMGAGGELTVEFARLLSAMWDGTHKYVFTAAGGAGPSSITPITFPGRYSPAV